MARPNKERVKKWREKKAKEGGRSLSVWLEPETARMMDELLEHYGQTASPLTARAIKTLYDLTFAPAEPEAPPEENLAQGESGGESVQEVREDSERAQAFSEAKEQVEKVAARSASDPQKILDAIKEKLAQGILLRDLKKPYLLAWIKCMKDQGVSFEEMAGRLNKARIPTLSGRGEWERGALSTIFILNYR